MAGKGGKRPGAGRKPKADEKRIKDLTSPYVPDAIENIVSIMNDPETKTSDRIAASKVLLSYAWGMPKQVTELDIEGEISSPPTIVFTSNGSEDK